MLSSLVLALAMLGQDGQASQAVEAKLESCVMQDAGWVCSYRVPPNTEAPAPRTVAPDGQATLRPAPSDGSRPARADRNTAFAEREVDDAEKARQARLIRRCADASWLSLCSPGDRREAKALRAAAQAKTDLKLKVTTQISQGDCKGAVDSALQAGDLALARDARDFCASPK